MKCGQFEKAIVKVIQGEENNLTEMEKIAIAPFINEEATDDISEQPAGAIALALHCQQKKQKVVVSKYGNLQYISPTSNIVERLFSSSRQVLTDYRKSMSNYSFESVMLLQCNSSLWDLELINSLVNKHKE